MAKPREYVLINPHGYVERKFSSHKDAFDYLAPDSPDLELRDLSKMPYVEFADGYKYGTENIIRFYHPPKKMIN